MGVSSTSFKKGHPFIKGGEKGWFKKGSQINVGRKRDPAKDTKRVTSWFKTRQFKPNRIEEYLINLINLAGLPYKFVGDGQLIILNKCPDFVNVNGQKKIIEIAGNYWHTPEKMQVKEKVYSEFGYKTLVLWESDIRQMTENQIIEKIKQFDGGD